MSADRDISVLKELLRTGIAAADPLVCVPPYLPEPPAGRTVVIGAGKAAARMALAVQNNWRGPLSGLVITRFGHGVPLNSIEVIEAGHPVPEEGGLAASLRMCDLLKDLTGNDLVLFLVSGGGSALLEVPAPGLTMGDIKSINRQLLDSGAPISEMNCVRKHLSLVKGGRLTALASPAKLVTVAISDVPGDDPSVIASGPTVPDPTTQDDAREIIARYGIDLSDAVRQWLESAESETPKPGDPVFASSEFIMAARPADMVSAVGEKAEAMGYDVLSLGADIEGDAAVVGAEMAEKALGLAKARGVGSAPLLMVSGGETTVVVTNPDGRGGRNSTFLLSLLIGLDGHKGISALAADTDGIDGSEDNAGAWINADTLAHARTAGLDAEAMLANNQSYDFFDHLGTVIRTGPTGTNVNDLRLILIRPT